jgi:dCMP deaminase
MPSGWSNVCEESTLWLDGKQLPHPILITKPEVLHAEENAITKLARSNESGEGAIAFITHAPCLSCAKLLYSTGIIKVYYTYMYRDSAGIDFLKKCKIGVDNI